MLGEAASVRQEAYSLEDLHRDVSEGSTEWLAALIRRGQDLGLVRCDLPEDLLIGVLMGFSMAFDRWYFEHWDALSDDERVELADKAIDAYVRLLQPNPASSGATKKRPETA